MSEDSGFVPLHPEGAPGHIHALLGDALFKTTLAGSEVQVETARKCADAMVNKVNTVSATIALATYLVATLAVLTMLPVLVWLWRWAL